MKNSITRVQSQAGLSFAERTNRRSATGGTSTFRPQVKRILSMLVLLMAVATGAWAKSAAASIGETPYATLAEAFAAAQTGETIKLWADVSSNNTVGPNEGRVVTFDLNGHVYTCNNDYPIQANGSGTQVTIIDSSTDKTGGIKSLEHTVCGTDGGKIILMGGRYDVGVGVVTATELLPIFAQYGVEIPTGYTLEVIPNAPVDGFYLQVVPPASATYSVSMKDGTTDATSWTIEPATAAEGTEVTATYAGTKKVKSVQATSPGVTPVALTSSANGTVWTLAQMPAYAVELEVTYYTDEEIAQQDEEAFTNGVALTKNADGTWTLAQMPGFDLELEVEYNDETEPVEPTHTAGTAWVQKDGFHYHPCTDDGCPFNSENLTADDFANDQNAAAILSYGEHSYGRSQEGAKYYTCQECQYVSTARQSETHTHNYAWVTTPDTKDGDNPIVVGKHWKECNAQGGVCDPVKTDEGDHVYDDQATDSKYYVCSTCNYTSELRKNDPNRPHAHEFSTTWTKTEDTSVNEPGAHYYQCIAAGGTCPLKYDGTDNEALEQYGKHVYGTSQEKSAYFTCKTCGYKSEVRKGQTHTHQYGDWKHDASYHWKECTAQEGACYAPTTGLNYHTYYTTDNTQTPEDDRAVCSECGWYNEARKHALDNAALAALVQSWSWDYEIPFNFEATVQNDRHMNADQCYTVFLPYAIELNDLKAYAIEQHNSNIIGFKEQAVTELPQLTPYIVKAKTTGNPLSSDMTTVYMTLLKSDQAEWMTQAEKDALIPDRGAASPQASIHDGNDRLYMFGSLRYLTNEAQGRYIMQGKDADHPNGLFKLVSTPGAYDQVDNRSCVLPMRAYIGQIPTAVIGGARQLLTVVFYDADGSATAVERLVVDDDALVIYDLQGRRVQNPRKGGLYIVNGVKTVIK